MDTINELMWVLLITALGLCIGFGVFLYKHEKEHKKEMNEKKLREARDNKNSTGQPDQSVHDVTSRASTTPASPTASP